VEVHAGNRLFMARQPRHAPGGIVYHVLNRVVARLPHFQKPADYDAFQRVLGEALERCPIRILAFVLMPNHWHFALWPKREGDLFPLCFLSGEVTGGLVSAVRDRVAVRVFAAQYWA
jgi:hypothetical protein